MLKQKILRVEKSKIKNKIGSYNTSFGQDRSRILCKKIRLNNGHTVSQYVPTEMESELIIPNEDMPTITHKPIIELEFIGWLRQ